MSWLASSETTRIIREMEAEFAAIDARDALKPKDMHVCGVCGQQAKRLDTTFDGSATVYRCQFCGLPTVVDHRQRVTR